MLCCRFIAASQDLVPNAGFEEHTKADDYAGYGLHHVSSWYQPTGGTSDCFHTSQTGFTKVPKNDFGTQQPRSGNGYGGFCAYMPQYREYLAVELRKTLRAGQRYKVEFYVSLSENSVYAIDKIQALLTSDKILDTTLFYVLGHKPQVVSKEIIEERNGWVPVSGEFIAKGDERYLLLGTFLHDKLLNVKRVKLLQKSRKEGEWAYYYVDDVSVCAVDENGNCIEEPSQEPVTSVKQQQTTDPRYTIGEDFVLKDVFFDVASARLQERSYPALDSLADFLIEHGDLSLTLSGHTDSTGRERDNWPLSRNRVESVKTYLVSKGIDAGRISGDGYASTRPLDTNATVEGRQRNRRVEARLERK